MKTITVDISDEHFTELIKIIDSYGMTNTRNGLSMLTNKALVDFLERGAEAASDK